MKNLKSVELNFDLNPVAPSINEFLKQNTPIEGMDLYRGTIDNNAIESICKITTIKEIYFSNCTGLDSNKFIRLVETLPNLKKIVSCLTDDPAEFLDEILPILKDKCIEWSDERDEEEFGSYVSCMFTFQPITSQTFFFKGP